MDTAGEFDDPMSAANVERRSWTALSAEVGFSSNVHVDVLSVPRYRGGEGADKPISTNTYFSGFCWITCLFK
jgi:hypothetical protein